MLFSQRVKNKSVRQNGRGASAEISEEELATLTGKLATDLKELQEAFEPVHEHIQGMWEELTRSHKSWFLGALEDEKVPNGRTPPYYLYISDKEDIDRVRQEVMEAREAVVERIRRYATNPKSETNPDGEERVIKVELEEKMRDGRRVVAKKLVDATEDNIPALEDIKVVRLERDSDTGYLKPPPADQHGLIYLPHPYIVPGVRFNEMYDWDSAFVVRGLLHDEEFERAKFLVDNMLYQIEYYGAILNGNRTYYLDAGTPRSQPPLLTGKMESVYINYESLENAHHGQDKVVWLKEALEYAERNYDFWMTPPHVAAAAKGSTLVPLSMYNSQREVPSQEVEYCEPEHYKNARDKLTKMYRRLTDRYGEETIEEILNAQTLSDVQGGIVDGLDYQGHKDLYYIEQYLTFDESGKRTQLSGEFYRGDWAMRESGFDPSRRFGFFNVDIINHIPVCLNSLRYKSETEMAALCGLLVEDDPAHAPDWKKKKEEWAKKSEATKAAMQQLWDPGDAGNSPAFRDLNTNDRLLEKYDIPKFRYYDYATALFPMWAGVATDDQARMIVEDIYPKLMTPHGFGTGTRRGTGNQWDHPILWAPLQIAAMEALERYGYYEAAWNIGASYLKTQIEVFKDTGAMWEKLESITGTQHTHGYIDNGYSTNDTGFAWTNSAATEIMQALPRLLKKMQGKTLTAPEIPTTNVVPTQGKEGEEYPPFIRLGVDMGENREASPLSPHYKSALVKQGNEAPAR